MELFSVKAGQARLPVHRGSRRVSCIGSERQTIAKLLSPGEFSGLDSLIADRDHPFRCARDVALLREAVYMLHAIPLARTPYLLPLFLKK